MLLVLQVRKGLGGGKEGSDGGSSNEEGGREGGRGKGGREVIEQAEGQRIRIQSSACAV